MYGYVGTDIRMCHLINPDPRRCIFHSHMSPTKNIKIAYKTKLGV